MVRWIENKFGHGAVAWVFMTAAIVLAVSGIGWTIGFGVAGFETGLAISIPAIFLGGVGTLITGLVLDDADYL